MKTTDPTTKYFTKDDLYQAIFFLITSSLLAFSLFTIGTSTYASLMHTDIVLFFIMCLSGSTNIVLLIISLLLLRSTICVDEDELKKKS